jgi:hypothetical protein
MMIIETKLDSKQEAQDKTMYVKPNNQGRSRNHCCSVQAIFIKYYLYMCVCVRACSCLSYPAC